MSMDELASEYAFVFNALGEAIEDKYVFKTYFDELVDPLLNANTLLAERIADRVLFGLGYAYNESVCRYGQYNRIEIKSVPEKVVIKND